jgi:hypothetical protein
MKLDSVRNLKTTLKHKVYREISLSPAEADAHGLPAGRIADYKTPIPLLSLGVSPSGTRDFKVAVRIQHRSLERGPHVEHIDRESRGEMDVRYVGRAVKQTLWHQTKQRPLLIGASVGHFDTIGGTLGCFVALMGGGDGTPRILSNNQVLANENRGRRGDDIVQPNKFDRGVNGPDTIASLDVFKPLLTTGANRVDCALASVIPAMGFDATTLTGVGALAGLKSDFAGVTLVQKLGRTTGLTDGRVTAFELDNVVFEYDIGNIRFDDQIEIEGMGTGPFSKPGDSGSLVFTSGSLLAFGLLVAGSETGGSNGQGVSYASLMATVLNDLNAQLLT